jgi:GPH family glycoside/pentoside/hexuronide:cation symporter
MPNDSNRVPNEQIPPAPGLTPESSPVKDPVMGETKGDPRDSSGVVLRWRERLSYGVGDIGGNLIFTPIVAFLLFYMTEIAGVGAAIAGTILLLGRVMDGTLDLIIGTLIDKTSTRWGKARPWILVSAPFLVVTFFFLFNVPSGLDGLAREIYVFVFYFLCLGVGFVSSNLAYHTLLSVITSNSRMRVSLSVVRTVCAIATGLTVNAITLPLIATFGGGQAGWTAMTLIYGAIALITLLTVFFGTKERVKPAIVRDKSAKLPVRKLIRLLFRNPFFLLGFALFFVAYLLNGTTSVGVYYANDVLGNVGIYGLLSVAGLAPLLIGIWFMPAVTSRFGKRRPILIGVAVVLIGVGITFIDPTNITVLLIGTVIKGIGGVPTGSALFALIADIVDYGEWKTGVRIDGMTYGAATAGQNFGAGVGAALVGWLLAAGNYQAGAETQASTAVSMEIFLYLGIPGIVAVAQAIIIFFLNIDKHMPQMQNDLAARRMENINS